MVYLSMSMRIYHQLLMQRVEKLKLTICVQFLYAAKHWVVLGFAGMLFVGNAIRVLVVLLTVIVQQGVVVVDGRGPQHHTAHIQRNTIFAVMECKILQH